MDRRNFLSGIIGGITSAGLLVKASDAEILAFGGKEGQPIAAIKAEQGGIAEFAPVGTLVFNDKQVPIGVISRAQIEHIAIDVTTYSDTWQKYAPGELVATYTVVSRGPAKIFKS